MGHSWESGYHRKQLTQQLEFKTLMRLLPFHVTLQLFGNV